MPAPVALFVYKRPEHTKATLTALARNTLAPETDIHIFSDGPKTAADWGKVEEVRQIAKEATGFASVRIVEREGNLGLANSIIQGVTDILASHKNIIVLEDDLVSSRHFLSYMNGALEAYKDDPLVFSVTGHTFPAEYMPIPKAYPFDTYAGYRCSSWSWGTWPDRWQRIDWEMKYFAQFSENPIEQERFNRGGPDMTPLLRLQQARQIDSWAIRFCYAHHANDMRCIYPVKTLIRNIGLDNSGTHSKPERRFFHASLDEAWLPANFCSGDYVEPRVTASFRSVFEPPAPNPLLIVPRKMIAAAREIYRRGRSQIAKVRNRIAPRARNVDILVVNTLQRNGGAARAAYRAFRAVQNRFPEAHYLTLTKEDNDSAVSGRMQASAVGLLVRALSRLDRLPLEFYPRRQHATFSPAFWANPLRIPLKRFRPKLVHLHWVGGGMLRIEELARLKCPIVWTLHDTWAFTGGCHYPRECVGYKKQCGHCPQLGSEKQGDYSRALMRRKSKVYENLNLTVVTPSRWLANIARQSSLFANTRIEVIPNGLDLEKYKPFERRAAREYLDIPPDMPVLLFGAQSLSDPRKGGDLLREALKRLDTPCTLMLFGEGQLSLDDAPHVTVRRLGSLADDISLALIYSAADVFLCPSREDNLPNTVAEAFACGTPCVAFDINGLPDMIDHQKNGWLAKPFDPASLAEGIKWLLENPERDQMRWVAREKAVAKYSLDLTGESYARLYSKLLGE